MGPVAMFFTRMFVVATSLLFCSSALAAHIDLAWNSNSEPDLAGYVVYYGTSSNAYTTAVDTGKGTSVRITGLAEDTEYFFALTAYNIYGVESDFSAEVSGYAAPGNDPGSDPAPGSAEGGGCFVATAF
jgi:hypothetical protein